MSNALTYWMSENNEGHLEFTSVPPNNGKTYIAVTPDFLRKFPIMPCEASADKNTFHIKGSLSSLYAVGSSTALTLLAFIAPQNSEDGAQAQIYFAMDQKYYPLRTISDAGYERDICKGDIVANKVCLIRYNPITEHIILVNPSMDKEATIYNLKVYGEAEFASAPKVRKEYKDTEGNIQYEYLEIPTLEQYEQLLRRIEKLESRFIIGIEEPKEALEDADPGVIYLKIGNILT